jgi:hypothetical protein
MPSRHTGYFGYSKKYRTGYSPQVRPTIPTQSYRNFGLAN